MGSDQEPESSPDSFLCHCFLINTFRSGREVACDPADEPTPGSDSFQFGEAESRGQDQGFILPLFPPSFFSFPPNHPHAEDNEGFNVVNLIRHRRQDFYPGLISDCQTILAGLPPNLFTPPPSSQCTRTHLNPHFATSKYTIIPIGMVV